MTEVKEIICYKCGKKIDRISHCLLEAGKGWICLDCFTEELKPKESKPESKPKPKPETDQKEQSESKIIDLIEIRPKKRDLWKLKNRSV